MEQKNIGSFIAELRKQRGMTQKELAAQLHVSDKTISRWERGDSIPDLTLLPALADIFGVTCDELLRGECRASPTQPEAAPVTANINEHLPFLTANLSRHKTRTLVSAGLSAAGLIAAMAGNLGFSRAYIGFLAGTVFYLAGIICQWASTSSALLAVSHSSPTEAGSARFRWVVIGQAQLSFGLTAVLFAFSLPLAILPQSAFAGLHAGLWLLYGGVFAAVTLILTATVCYFLNAALLKKDSFHFHELTHAKGFCVFLQLTVLLCLWNACRMAGFIVHSAAWVWVCFLALPALHLLRLTNTVRSNFMEDRSTAADLILYSFSGLLFAASAVFSFREDGAILPDIAEIERMLQYDLDDGLVHMLTSFGFLTSIIGLLACVLLVSICVSIRRELSAPSEST